MDKDEPKQLKLTNRLEGEGKKDLPASRQGKKEKEPKGNKWIVFAILVITIIISLFFYFRGWPKTTPLEIPLGGPKVYQF